MADFTRVAAHVAGGGHENAAHVHQLAEGEVDEQHADERDMGEEQGVQAHGGLRREVQDAHDEHLGLGDVHLVNVTHADARTGHADQQKQREPVGGLGNVAQLFGIQAAQEQKAETGQNEGVGKIEAGMSHLHHAVKKFDDLNAYRHRFKEKAGMAHDDDQHAVVEQQREHPQPLGRIISSESWK